MQKNKEKLHSDDMPYISEKVVAKYRRRWIRHCFTFILTAFLFGIAAASSFLVIMRFMPQEQTVISVDSRNTVSSDEQQRYDYSERSPLDAYYKVKDAFVTVSVLYKTGDWIDEAPIVLGARECFGVIIAENSKEYYILTSAEVIDEAENIFVIVEDISVETTVKAENHAEDIAVLSIDKEDLPDTVSCGLITLGNSSGLKSGDFVIAAGNPYAFVGSVNYGKITYIGIEEACDIRRKVICSDMSSSAEGHGVLLNQNGEIIAWITDSYEDGMLGLICGAAIEEMHQRIRLMIEGEQFAYLGVSGREITEELSQTHNIPEGYYVTKVAEDSPAKAAGLHPGDFIHSIDEQQIRNGSQLADLLSEMEVGDMVTIELERRDQDEYKKMLIEVVLGER